MTQAEGNVAVIIAAAGIGARFGGKQKKQYRRLGGIPVLSHSVRTFDCCDLVGEIFVVISPEDRRWCQDEVITPLSLRNPVHLVGGGAHRQESVLRGLEATQGRFPYVAIHDGVRPFVSAETVLKCVEKARQYGACIPVEPITDTVKEVDGKNVIRSTMDRKRLRLAQTPQVFRYDLIWNAHQVAARQGYQGTDDAELVERLGTPVKTVSGSLGNIKITTPGDLAFAGVLWENAQAGSSLVPKP